MINRQKILIVDDDNNIAELISLYLAKECFETHIVNDGESALACMDTFFQPDNRKLFNGIILPKTETVFCKRCRAFGCMDMFQCNIIEPDGSAGACVMMGYEHRVVTVIPVNTADMYAFDSKVTGR